MSSSSGPPNPPRPPGKPDPGKMKQCPRCRGQFACPEAREVEGDFTFLDYHCPNCGYHIARWPKDSRDAK